MNCGADWWAFAAGTPVHPGSQPAGPVPAAPWWTAASRGQLQRIGFGLAGIFLIAAYAWADGAFDVTGRQAGMQPTTDVVDRPDERAGRPATPSLPGAEAESAAPSAPRFPAAGQVQPAGMASSAPAVQAPPTPAPAVTPTVAPATPAPTPTAIPVPSTIVLEGTGSLVSQPFDYPGGSVRVRSVATAGGAGCYYIGTFAATDPALLPVDASFRTTVLFLEGAGSAEGWVDLALPPGTYFLQIDSDCDWTVTIEPA